MLNIVKIVDTQFVLNVVIKMKEINCLECENGKNLIRGLECFHCGNTKVKYYKNGS